MISGAIGGLATAFSSSDYSGGIIIGAVTAAVASLALGHVFRGSDSSPVPAFIISVPHSGWLGELASAILTEAGFWGAFLGCGVGYVAGTTLLTVATLFIFRDNPSEREQQNTTQFGNIARLQEPTPTLALQANQKYEAITYGGRTEGEPREVPRHFPTCVSRKVASYLRYAPRQLWFSCH